MGDFTSLAHLEPFFCQCKPENTTKYPQEQPGTKMGNVSPHTPGK